MKIKGVLWDLDGVLVDTGELHYQAWQRTLAGYQIPYSRDLFRETFGMNNWSILSLLLGDRLDYDLYMKISGQKEEAFREVLHGRIKPLPGAVETLQSLGSRGIPQAIASSAPQENIDAMVDELGLRAYFKAIVSAYTMPGKPAPDVFLASAKAIGIPPRHCLVIEDSVAGVEGARRAGMTCLAVTNTNPREALRQADYVVDSLLLMDAVFWESLIGKPNGAVKPG
jgi:HAD superfamily hydrolase (TIGR01509 family)